MLLQKFSSNIICTDNIYSLNSYDFELVTLMIVDEFGEGFPILCKFSNRKDTMNNFFIFMSDITNTYFNAWCAVMDSTVENRLLCS